MKDLEKKIEKLKVELAQVDKQWEERQEQLKQSFNQEYGVYVGRRHTLEEVLKMLDQDDDEKNEGSAPDTNGIAPENTENG